MLVLFRAHLVMIWLCLCSFTFGSRCLFPWCQYKLNSVHPTAKQVESLREESTVSLRKEYPIKQIPKFDKLIDDSCGIIFEFLNLDEGLQLRLVCKALKKSYDSAIRRSVGMTFWYQNISDHIVLLEYSNVAAWILAKRVVPILKCFLSPEIMMKFPEGSRRRIKIQSLIRMFVQKVPLVDFFNILMIWLDKYDSKIMAGFLNGLLSSELITLDMLSLYAVSDWHIVFERCCTLGLKQLAPHAFRFSTIRNSFSPGWIRTLLHRVCVEMIQYSNLAGFKIALDTSASSGNVLDFASLNILVSYIMNMDNVAFLDEMFKRFPDLVYLPRLINAITSSRIKTMTYLLEHLPFTARIEKGSTTLLHLAAVTNDAKIISAVMSAGYADVLAQNAKGLVPIQCLLCNVDPDEVSVGMMIEEARRWDVLIQMLGFRFPNTWKSVYDVLKELGFDHLI